MTLKILLVACSLLALAGCGEASAAKRMTFGCTFVEERGPRFHAGFFQVDRVMVDFDEPRLHLGVSSTMDGWTFKNGPPPLVGDPEDQLMISVDGDGTIRALTVRSASMAIFVITKSNLVATAVSEDGVVSHTRFRCTRS